MNRFFPKNIFPTPIPNGPETSIRSESLSLYKISAKKLMKRWRIIK